MTAEALALLTHVTAEALALLTHVTAEALTLTTHVTAEALTLTTHGTAEALTLTINGAAEALTLTTLVVYVHIFLFYITNRFFPLILAYNHCNDVNTFKKTFPFKKAVAITTAF